MISSQSSCCSRCPCACPQATPPSCPEGERPDVLSPGCPSCVGEEAEGGATGLSERPYSQGRKERGWRRDGRESAGFFRKVTGSAGIPNQGRRPPPGFRRPLGNSRSVAGLCLGLGVGITWKLVLNTYHRAPPQAHSIAICIFNAFK